MTKLKKAPLKTRRPRPCPRPAILNGRHPRSFLYLEFDWDMLRAELSEEGGVVYTNLIMVVIRSEFLQYPTRVNSWD